MKFLIAAIALVSVGFSVNAMAAGAQKSLTTEQCSNFLIARETATYEQRVQGEEAYTQSPDYASKLASFKEDLIESKRQIRSQDACALLTADERQALQN